MATSGKAAPRPTVSIEAFLAGLPDQAAAEARAAAARIDELERVVGPPGWIERNMKPLSLGSLVMFGLGLAGFAGILGGRLALVWVVILIAGFPGLTFAYLLSVRGRTRLDDEKMALNRKHFEPHGGIYFGTPAGRGERPGLVVLIAPVVKIEPDLRARTQALHDAATRKNW